jgi:hypothetical protein
MFEWKAFESKEKNIDSLNLLLNLLAHKGWDIMQVDFDLFSVLARKSKTLLD